MQKVYDGAIRIAIDRITNTYEALGVRGMANVGGERAARLERLLQVIQDRSNGVRREYRWLPDCYGMGGGWGTIGKESEQ